MARQLSDSRAPTYNAASDNFHARALTRSSRRIDMLTHRSTALGITSLALLVAVPLTMGTWARAAEPKDTAQRFGAALVPADSVGFIAIRMDDIIASPCGQATIKKFGKDIPLDVIANKAL